MYYFFAQPQLPLTSRSAEASPIDGPTGDKSPAGRVIFQRSVSEYVHPIHALNEEEDGLDANYRVNTRRRNNSGGPGGEYIVEILPEKRSLTVCRAMEL